MPALCDRGQVCGPLGLGVLMAKFRAGARTPGPLWTPVPGSCSFRVLLAWWHPRLAVPGGGRWAPAGLSAACPSRRQTRPGRAPMGGADLTRCVCLCRGQSLPLGWQRLWQHLAEGEGPAREGVGTGGKKAGRRRGPREHPEPWPPGSLRWGILPPAVRVGRVGPAASSLGSGAGSAAYRLGDLGPGSQLRASASFSETGSGALLPGLQ